MSQTSKDSSPKVLDTSSMLKQHTDPRSNDGGAMNFNISQTEEDFVTLVSKLNKLESSNFCAFLVEFMKIYHHRIPLETLFEVLYKETPLDSGSVLPDKLATKDASNSIESSLTAVHFCRIILLSLQKPSPTMSLECTPEKPESSPVIYHELLRSFLAVKIIYATVKKIDGSTSALFTIPRISVYKVYYIICQRLIQQSGISSVCANQSLILGQSKLGKIANLIFPNQRTKRLGKRGKSKCHYIGLILDSSSADQEILKLSELEMPQLREYFKRGNNQGIKRHASNPAKVIPQPRRDISPQPLENTISVNSLPPPIKPIHTYVDASYTFPDIDCSPRVWKMTPGSVPKHSRWALDNMQRSLVVLKEYEIELDPLIRNYSAGKFVPENHESLSNCVLQSMVRLQGKSAPKEAYLHLYFTVLVLLFPVVISSDAEVDVLSKSEFRTSVSSCISKLESAKNTLSCIDEAHLNTFVGILRKMVHFNEMTSSKIKVPYNKVILKEMIGHLDTSLTANPNDFTDRSPLEAIYIRSIIMAMNSYSFTLVDDTSSASESDLVEKIDEIADDFKTTVMAGKEMMKMIITHGQDQGFDDLGQDLPFQVVMIAMQILHEVALKKTLVLKLPMVVVAFIIRHFTNSMQYVCLHDFKKGDSEFAQECFKGCWVYSQMHQDYLRFISEVVALNKILWPNFPAPKKPPA